MIISLLYVQVNRELTFLCFFIAFFPPVAGVKRIGERFSPMKQNTQNASQWARVSINLVLSTDTAEGLQKGCRRAAWRKSRNVDLTSRLDF